MVECSKIRVAGLCLALATCLAPVAAYEADPRFIFVSSPSKRKIYYAPLPSLTELAKHPDDRLVPAATMLIDGSVKPSSGGVLGLEAPATPLETPEGLAVWHGKDKAVLYVADTAAKKIFAYQITASLAGAPVAGVQQLVAKDIEGVTSLALDGFGNLYFTTNNGRVGTLSSEKLLPLTADKPTVTILYTSESTKTVSTPFGLAADNFNVYWSNQANGQQNGAIVKAFERNVAALKTKYPQYPMPLSKTMTKAMGVCVAKSNVFFTGVAQTLYGVKTTGGSISEVSRSFEEPRGCAFDGENTLYVADAKTGSISSLPANFITLPAAPLKKLQKVATVEAPSAVAVFTCSFAYVAQQQDNGFLGLGW